LDKKNNFEISPTFSNTIKPVKKYHQSKVSSMANNMAGTNKTEVENSPEWTLYRKKHGLDKKTKIFICK
jgi:hypothetical protein